MEVVPRPLPPMPESLRRLTEGQTRVAATAIADAADARRRGGASDATAVSVAPAGAEELSTNLRIRYEDGETGRKIVLRVGRGSGDEGYADYDVPVIEGMVVLDAIHWIQANLASDLACRWNCKAGKCGSCSAEINGRPALLCKTRVDQLDATGRPVSVQPMQAFPLVRDLVTDVSWNYTVNQRIPPFTPAPGVQAPFTIAQRDIERVAEFRKCIECFLCQDVCHVLREHRGTPRFFGPRFMVRLASLEMHPKDALDRVPMLTAEAGVGYCNITKCCTEVCPEHIRITDNAIIPLKERMADRHFDPIRAVVARIRPAPVAPSFPPSSGPRQGKG